MAGALAMRREYRLQKWAKIVARCRESGMSNRESCRENGIAEKTFYYRFRQLRETAVEQAPRLVDLEGLATPKEGLLRIQYRGASLELPENIEIEALAPLLRSIQSC